MNILVTGGAGFIGSNFVRHMLETHDDVHLVNLDSLTYAGNLENLEGVEESSRYRFVKGDIRSSGDVEGVLTDAGCEVVVNFAAESHVDRSLHFGAHAFIETNVSGVQTLLDACRRHGVRRFVQVSTDEVYGSLGPEGRFTEASPIQPNNPYAATKAAADFLVRAAHESHGLDCVITRCSNNFGPCQFPEKLIPLMIANAAEDKPLPVYGDGLHVRDWIYVRDHCAAVDAAMRRGKAGEIYNFGGSHDVPNIDIVRGILRILGKPETLITYVTDRPGHDRRYAMDSRKANDELGWEAAHTFDDALAETVDWYRAHGKWLAHVRSGEYAGYYERLYGERLADASGIGDKA